MYCEPEFHQQGAVLLAQNGGCSVWQFRNESGEGTMTTYELCPGVALSFNDFHMASFDSSFTTRQKLLAIDYCREGRMEYTAAENAFSYIKAGDLKLDRRLTHQGTFVFPSSHYHGITVGLDLSLAETALPQQMQDFPVTPAALLEKFRLGSPAASDEEVKAAARAAQCEEFIAKLPQGYDTPAGESGKRLSGGEKQRIAIARMLLKNAPIIILDEATASVDPENEHLIQSAVSELTRGKTIITIAHRLATIEHADQILVVDDGRIVEQGTHEELIRQPGRYQQFVHIPRKSRGLEHRLTGLPQKHTQKAGRFR